MGRRTSRREHTRIASEIEGLPAHALPDLPLPVCLWLDVPGAPVPVCFSTAARDPQAAEGVLAPRVVFDRDEVAALVVGAEQDRLWRKELLALCFEKWRRPALRIDLKDALSGAVATEPMLGWSVGQVLARLGATLVRVDLPQAELAKPMLPRAA